MKNLWRFVSTRQKRPECAYGNVGTMLFPLFTFENISKTCKKKKRYDIQCIENFHVLLSLFVVVGDTLSMFAECSFAFNLNLSMLVLRMSIDSVSYGWRVAVGDVDNLWTPPPRNILGTPKAFELIAGCANRPPNGTFPCM